MDIYLFLSDSQILLYSIVAGALVTAWYLRNLQKRPNVDPRFQALQQELGGSLRKGPDGSPSLTVLQLGRMWTIVFVDEDPAKPYLEIRCPVFLAWEMHIYHYPADEAPPQVSQRSGLSRLELSRKPWGERVIAWANDERATKPILEDPPLAEPLSAIFVRPLAELWLGKRELIFWSPLGTEEVVDPQPVKQLLQHLTAIIEHCHERA